MAQAESTAMAEHARSVRRAADKDERRKKNIHKALRASRGRQRQQMSALLRARLPNSIDLQYCSNSSKDVATSSGGGGVLQPRKTNDKTIILLDANELLLFRRYDAELRKYTEEVTRPFVWEFVTALLKLPGVSGGLWTGVLSVGQEKLILDALAVAGVPRASFSVILRAFPCCGRTGSGMNFPGTKKRVFVKPVSIVQDIMPEYSHYLLVDNNVEKSQGLGPASARRLANSPMQHLEPPPFRGELVDGGLQPDRGLVWTLITERLRQLRRVD